MEKNKKGTWTSYCYLMPSIFVFTVFLFYPFFKTIYLSLFKTDKMGQAKLFVGFGNYLDLFQSASFRNSLKVTLLFVVIVVTVSMFFLFRQFYMTFPISLYESAKLDGCTNLRFIVNILVPLTKSAIGTMAVYTFINAWNMYMWPLLVTGSDKMRTVQIGISMLNSVDSQSITLMIAGVVMIIIPSISIFIAGQKQLIRGMFSGAVKG